MNSHLLSLFISYRSSREKLIKYQSNSSCVIMSVILMTTLFYKALTLQGEIWCWSLWGLKGLITKALTTQRWASSRVSFPGYVGDRESCIAAPARKWIRAPSAWESSRTLPATYCLTPVVFLGFSLTLCCITCDQAFFLGESSKMGGMGRRTAWPQVICCKHVNT